MAGRAAARARRAYGSRIGTATSSPAAVAPRRPAPHATARADHDDHSPDDQDGERQRMSDVAARGGDDRGEAGMRSATFSARSPRRPGTARAAGPRGARPTRCARRVSDVHVERDE